MCRPCALLFLGLMMWLAPATRAVELVPDWEDIPYNPYPLMPAVPQEPVLTAEDVTDDSAWFIADPFLLRDGGTWHLFFEVWSNTTHLGKIGHAVSEDGLNWTYDCIVLSESFHLSFPYIFKYGEQYLMIVVVPDPEAVTLYMAHNFPYDWQHEATLLTGHEFADPAIIRHDDMWWLFSGRSGTGYCDLYYSPDLESGWVEHPMSPIVNDFGKGRPAGRFPVFGNGHVLRLAQKNNNYYGEAVRAFEIDLLTTTQYSEHEIPESPILSASGCGWNRDGMHTCDAWWNGDHWLAAVDGVEDLWSIGIYRTGPAAPVVEAGPASEPLRLELLPCSPNPFRYSTDILYRVNGDLESSAVQLRIYAVDGHLVREDLRQPTGPGFHTIRWDGTDARGTPIENGIYLYQLAQGSRKVSGRMIHIH